MTAAEFIISLSFAAIARITIVQFGIFILAYQLVKSRQSSIIDPFTLALFFFASGWAIVMELLLMGMVSFSLLAIFLITNIAFIFGYLIIAPRSSTQTIHRARLGNFRLFGLIALATYIWASLINIWFFGFGISYENRLDIYTESGGLGALKRVMDAYMPASVFFLVYLIGSKRGLKKMGAVLLFAFAAMNTILDGSKSGLVAIFLTYVISQRWLQDSKLIPPSSAAVKRTYLWILCAFIFAFLVIGFQLQVHEDLSRTGDLFALLFFRLSIAGDIFILGFPGDTIDKIQNPNNPILVLFSDLLSTLRIWSGNVIPLGTELLTYLSPDRTLITGGPNAHISIYVYHLFGGIGGTFLALLFGLLYGLIRKMYTDSVGNDPVIAALVITLLLNCANIPIDPSYSMHRITNITIFLMPLVIFLSSKFRNKY